MRDARAAFVPEGKVLAAADEDILSGLLGYALSRRAARALSKRLLAELHSLPRVVAASDDTLVRLAVPAKAIALLRAFQRAMVASLQRGFANTPVLSGAAALADYLHVSLAHAPREAFRVLFLDNKNGLICDEQMSSGTVNQTQVYVREVIKRALDVHATAIILVHNHPSGDPKPSHDDIRITLQFRDAARVIGIAVHDHIIVGSLGQQSLKALGYL